MLLSENVRERGDRKMRERERKRIKDRERGSISNGGEPQRRLKCIV